MSKQSCRVSMYNDLQFTDKIIGTVYFLYTNTITSEKFHYIIIVLLCEREQ